jgi:hypothetical protein
MRIIHPYRLGRNIGWVPVTVISAQLLAYTFWYASISGNTCGVGSVELLSVVAVIAGSWMITPKMATWDALATSKVRRITAGAATLLLSIAALTPLAVYAAVNSLPAHFVPNSDRFDFGGLGPSVWFPAVTNVLCIGSIALIGIAAFGRTIGTVGALTAYAALFGLSAATKIPAPYVASCSTNTAGPAWVPASALSVVAVVVWHRTGGTTRVARRFDPRH